MTVVGEVSLWIALFLSVWASAAGIAGAKLGRSELVVSGGRAVRAAAAMVAVACAGLWSALLGHDFALEYVASHTTLNTPALYLITAFWAGPGGRVLFLALAVATAAVVVLRAARRFDTATHHATINALAALLALLLVIVCFAVNPFDRAEWVPAEGQGLDPQLQTPLATLFFVTTYAGYGAAAVALSLAVAAALVGRVDVAWVERMHRWCLACWCLLTIAIAARMRWSYLEPSAGSFPGLDRAQLTTIVVWALTLGLVIALRGRRATGDARAGPPLGVVGWLGLGLGLALVIGGIVARRSWTDRSVSVRPGESAEVSDRFGERWRFVSQGVSRDEQPSHLSTSVALETWRDGERLGFISAERRQYLDSVQRPTFEPAIKPGIEVTPQQDVYVVLSGLRSDAADLRVSFRPLVSAVWIGWVLVLIAGLLVGLSPPRRAAARRGLLAPSS